MHRGRQHSSPAPGWVALKEPSSTGSSEGEEDARDEMDDQITDGNNAGSSNGVTRPASSHTLAQRKRKDSNSGSFEKEKSRKRARHDHGSPNRAGGERRGGVSGSGEVGSSGHAAGPSRTLNSNSAIKATTTISTAGPRPSAPSSSTSTTTTMRPPAHPLPSGPRVSISTKDGSNSYSTTSASSSSSKPITSKPSSSASSFQKNEFQSKLSSDLFRSASKAGPSSTQANKKPPTPQQQHDDGIIDLTLEEDNSPPRPPKPKLKPRASMAGTVVDMSDEERRERGAASSAIRGRPKGKTRKSTGDIGKSISSTKAADESDVIVISSDEEEKEKEKPGFAALVRRLPVSMRKDLPAPALEAVAGPSSTQEPTNQAKAAETKTTAPSSANAEIKAPVSTNSERTHPELPTGRPSGVGLLSPLPAPTSASPSSQAARPSQAMEKTTPAASSPNVVEKEKVDDKMNVDVPLNSKTNGVKSHRTSASIDGRPPSMSKHVSSQKQKEDQNQYMQVDPVPPSQTGPPIRPKTPTSAAVGSVTHKRVPSATSAGTTAPKTPTNTTVGSMAHKPLPSASTSASGTNTVSKPSSSLETHRPSSSLDAKSHERRTSQQMRPQAMEVDQPQPDPTNPPPLAAASASTPSTIHKRVPSSSTSATHTVPKSRPRRPQVAVKSTGGIKPRLPKQRYPSTSSSPDESDSDSSSATSRDKNKDGKEDKDENAVSAGPSVSSAIAATASTGNGGIDMRDLDHALGLSGPTLTSAPPKQGGLRSPGRPARVKEQPIVPKSSADQAHIARKSTGGRGMSVLPEVMMSAMQSNAELHEKRRAPARAGETSAAGAGKAALELRQVIDLTLDISDEEAEKVVKAKGKEKEVIADLPSLQTLKESSKRLVDELSKLKEEHKASATAAPVSSRSSPETGSDELLLRSTHDGIEKEPSPPPSSPSPPPPNSVDTPLIPDARPAAAIVAVSAATSVVGQPGHPSLSSSSRRVIGSRHHSAPSKSVAVIQDPPSSPTGAPSTSTSTFTQSPARPQPQLRHASISSINEALAQKPRITEAQPTSKPSVPNVSAESPMSPGRRPLKSSPLRQEQKIMSPKVVSHAAPVTDRVPSPVPETPTSPSAKALGKRPQRDVPSDVEMDVDQQELFFTQSEDEAIQEAEEVQALVEASGAESGSSSSAEDHDMDYSIAVPVNVGISARAESSSSGASDVEAGPTNGLRRSSRQSSRSSLSVQSIEAFSVEDNALPATSAPPSRNTTPEEGINLAEGLSPIKRKTYGGFQALTWKEYRKNLNNFIPTCRYARDLPHSFQDHINQMSLHTRMMPDMRLVFEAMIRENTVEDEPDAPPITLENDVDNEPTPLWEFHYTNEMWHGEGVPPPDIKSLVSCDCKGGCNPKSKTCACLKRQREVVHDPTLEFAYTKDGRLKIPGFPVFECNDLCGCGPECQNRVVQHGRKIQIMVKKTQHKGWGVFAGGKKIPSQTFIGIYSGELLTDNEAHERGVNYNKGGRTYLFDLDFHHQKTGPKWVNQYTVDAYHAGNFTRFLNHSCDPNARLYPCYINEGNIQKPLLVIFSRRDIEPGEEICFSYSGSYPGDDDDDEEEEYEEDRGGDEGNEEGEEGKRDKVYGACKCGAKNCTGIIFRPPPSLVQD